MNKENKTELNKAGALITAGACVGESIGGSIGIAAFGGAFGIPLVLVGGTVGLIGYGAYKVYEGHFRAFCQRISPFCYSFMGYPEIGYKYVFHSFAQSTR